MKTAKKHDTHAFSGFELQKIVLHNLQHWGLKPQTKTVLWVLVDCYNPENGSVVFPSMEYIAKIGAMGLTSAKEGIKELINKGLIIKSKRSKVSGNYNKYLLTPKVQNPASEWSENELLERSKSDCFMITNNNRKNKEQTTKNNVVSLKNSFSKKSITLDDVPEIIKNKKHIENPCAYWASLSAEVKETYLQNQRKAEEKAKLYELKKKKQAEIAKLKKEQEQKHIEECDKPLIEQYTYETACKIIKNLAKVEKRLAYRGIAKELAIAFNIDIEKIIA